MKKPFWHETIKSKEDFNKLIEQKLTWGDAGEKYAQPNWCDYPDALRGEMGCWSLVGLYVKDEDYCKTCECHVDYVE